MVCSCVGGWVAISQAEVDEMKKLTVAVGQMDVQVGAVARNMAEVKRLAAEAAARGAQLLVLPELWATGYDLVQAERYATGVEAGVFAEVAALARAHGLHILGSGLVRLASGGVGNTAVWHDDHGHIVATYSKLHLFRLMQEEQFLTAGDAPTLAETAFGKMGLSICYDLRFPELFRGYALAGARVVFVPAEWPQVRLAHWRTLLRARAIENQLFVVGCNRVGKTGETIFGGYSAVVDPWGETLMEGDGEAGLFMATLDLEVVDEVRQRIPIFADRRPSAYGR